MIGRKVGTKIYDLISEIIVSLGYKASDIIHIQVNYVKITGNHNYTNNVGIKEYLVTIKTPDNIKSNFLVLTIIICH